MGSPHSLSCCDLRSGRFACAPLVDYFFASLSLPLFLTIATFREPAWHRRLRSKRKWARAFLKQPWSSLKNKAALTWQAIRRLSGHHGSNIPLHIMNVQGTEQWLCPCLPGGARNGPNRNYCSQCGYHYSKVLWWTSGKNRTRTRSQSRKKKDKRKQVEPILTLEDGKETSLLQPFGEGDPTAMTPWVTTTPSRTVKALTQFSPKNAESKKPSLEQPQEEVRERLAQLKQKLREKGVEDTEILNDLEELEKASKDGAPTNQLTHKSLSQLQKAERSLEVIQKQTQDLDAHWKKWSDYMKTKFEEQGKLYLEKRKLLSEKKKELGTKISALREEIQKAAQAQQTRPIDVDDWKPRDPGGFRSFRNQCIGRRERPGDGSWREEEQDNATSSRNTELSSKSGQNHVIFHEITQVAIFDDDATIGSPSFEFNIDHLALADWDSKPWALHPGTFTNAAARTILHGLCDDVPARDLHLHPCRVQGEGGQVPTGEPPWNGGQAQGVQLPHPAEGRDGDRDKDLRHDKVCELHGPAAASAILHGLCDGVPARDLHLHPCRVRGEGGQVPTGDLPWSGGQAQRDQLPHPVEGRDGDKDLRHDKVCELHGPDSDRKQSSQAKTCKIVSLGVYRGYIGKRIGRLRPQDIQDNEIVRGLLSELWSDYFDDHTTFHWPDPQPSQEKVLFIVVDFLPLHDVLHLGRVACLINVMGWNVDADSATNIVEAALVPERATWWEIIFDLGLQEQCRSRTGNQCLLRVGRRLILNDDPFIIPDRAAVVVNYDIADDEPPRVSLIQTQCYVKVCPGFSNEVDMSSGPPTTASSSSRSRPLPATSTSHRPALTTPGEPTDVPPEEATLLSASTRTYHLLHRTTDYQTATIDATDPFQERAQIATAWNVAPDVVIGIHPVRARPADFPDDGSIIVITRWVQDAELRAYPTDIQVLFDIEIHSGVAPSVDAGPKLFRHVDWSRRTMTRDGYLHTLRVKDYCHILAGDACLVWHNNILWPFQDMQQRDIRAGDYIRIAIPARGGQTIGGARRVLEISEERRVQRSSRNQSHLQMLFYVIKRHGAQRMLLPRAAGSQYRYLHMDFACNL